MKKVMVLLLCVSSAVSDVLCMHKVKSPCKFYKQGARQMYGGGPGGGWNNFGILVFSILGFHVYGNIRKKRAADARKTEQPQKPSEK